ncbi:PD-(D/E)XK motif protein [Phaeovibrio sulfidiphilus]|uniref:PD-(D/E)XK motif protein n=1 Tax=Phaeovibrio sulfidiphilus TaxID=1220600 RepID=A0A8J6YNR9_9PROT|nr:PD-(D/E)XK motif protein [Phaeovibrio sulfidiphilus]MBE1237990.1 PD-(D/E)XK motif protein [Phaeovibrio sulfidiphilus]
MTGWTEEGLNRIWKALSKIEASDGWRFLHLTDISSVSIMAGCELPLGRESLILSFPGSRAVNPEKLPDGKGFDVSHIASQTEFAGRTAIALVRRSEGSLDIFTSMVVDILRTIELSAPSGANRTVMDAFLTRLKEWQLFMARARHPLSSAEIIGLFGELWLLRHFLDTSLGIEALDCWQTNLHAAQDFRIKQGGAIEVKSTMQTGQFLAQISSIEQLDGAWTPIFLAALRFEENKNGISLADLVSQLRQSFGRAGAQTRFDALLTLMGYLDEHNTHYERKLALKEARVFRVDDNMPRLTRASLPLAIRSAQYVLDVDALSVPAVGLSELTQEFGLD